MSKAAAESDAVHRDRSPGANRVIRLWRVARELPLLAMAVMAMFVVCALFAPQIAPYDPIEMSLGDRLLPPAFVEGGSMAHILGTDTLGRDVLSRIIFGARISLTIAVAVILISSFLGLLIGMAAGYIGGRTDALLMRIADGAMAFPALLLALLFAISLGPGLLTMILALSVLNWANIARIIRGEVMQLRNTEFISQARIVGCSRARMMVTHLLPNVLNSLMVMTTMYIGLVVLSEATLGFMGAGVPPPTPSWGSMVAEGRNFFERAWWISLFPGLTIGLLVLSGNYLGDWLRDRLDPRLRQI